MNWIRAVRDEVHARREREISPVKVPPDGNGTNSTDEDVDSDENGPGDSGTTDSSEMRIPGSSVEPFTNR